MNEARIAVTRQPSFLAIIDKGHWSILSDVGSIVKTTAGSGSVVNTVPLLRTRSGSTASSTALARTHDSPGFSRGKNDNVINWSRRIVIWLALSSNAGTTNGKSRVTLGKSASSGIGDLAARGIGIRIDNMALKGTVHSGASLTNFGTATTLTASRVYDVLLVSDGQGRVELFVDGVSKGATSSGPTGDGAGGDCVFQQEVENGGDASNQNLDTHIRRLYVEV